MLLVTITPFLELLLFLAKASLVRNRKAASFAKPILSFYLLPCPVHVSFNLGIFRMGELETRCVNRPTK